MWIIGFGSGHNNLGFAIVDYTYFNFFDAVILKETSGLRVSINKVHTRQSTYCLQQTLVTYEWTSMQITV